MSNTVTVIATAKQIYKGAGIIANQEFEVTELDADDLVAINMARRKTPKRPPAAKPETKKVEKETIKTRDMTADDTPGDEATPVDSESVRSTYNRRDMRPRRS